MAEAGRFRLDSRHEGGADAPAPAVLGHQYRGQPGPDAQVIADGLVARRGRADRPALAVQRHQKMDDAVGLVSGRLATPVPRRGRGGAGATRRAPAPS